MKVQTNTELSLCKSWGLLLEKAGIYPDDFHAKASHWLKLDPMKLCSEDSVKAFLGKRGTRSRLPQAPAARIFADLVSKMKPSLSDEAESLFDATVAFHREKKAGPEDMATSDIVSDVPRRPDEEATGVSPEVIQLRGLEQFDSLIHAFSTRSLGNVSLRCGDSSNSRLNQERLFASLRISPSRVAFMNPQYDGTIIEIGQEDLGKTFNADCVISTVAESYILLPVADSFPIFMYCPKNNVFAVVCAGWKPTHRRICLNAISRLQNDFEVSPRDLVVGIGPGILLPSYPVPWEYLEQREDRDWQPYLYRMDADPDQVFVDVLGFNKAQIAGAGVPFENVFVSGVDTFTSKDFYSKRHYELHGGAGHFACVAGVTAVGKH